MSEPYTLDADLYLDISNIVTEDDTSKHVPSDIDLSPDISHIITADDTQGYFILKIDFNRFKLKLQRRWA